MRLRLVGWAWKSRAKLAVVLKPDRPWGNPQQGAASQLPRRFRQDGGHQGQLSLGKRYPAKGMTASEGMNGRKLSISMATNTPPLPPWTTIDSSGASTV
jgi:hypothetical protein